MLLLFFGEGTPASAIVSIVIIAEPVLVVAANEEGTIMVVDGEEKG